MIKNWAYFFLPHTLCVQKKRYAEWEILTGSDRCASCL